jgi:UTP--glucose-1-phosphate uridylyltransferase
MTNRSIKTAVFPVAGLGTRFLPMTKAAPKEMLPVVDKPVIQYVVEEAIAAGIEHIVFVTSSDKRAIEDYFDRNYELEMRLKERGNWDALKTVQDILPSNVCFSYVRQMEPLGLGHAVLSAKAVVGDQPFAVLLADDIIDDGDKGCLHKMVEIYDQTQASVIAVENVERSETDKYGIISLKNNDQLQVESIVEKPLPENAPSTLAVTGRYILTSRIFSLLENTERGQGGEIQLTDAIAMLLKEGTITAYPFEGQRYDCGSKLGLLKATIAFALKHPELRQALTQFFQQSLSDDSDLGA